MFVKTAVLQFRSSLKFQELCFSVLWRKIYSFYKFCTRWGPQILHKKAAHGSIFAISRGLKTCWIISRLCHNKRWDLGRICNLWGKYTVYGVSSQNFSHEDSSVSLNRKGVLLVLFLECGETINIDRYYEILMELITAILNKYRVFISILLV